MKPYLWLFGATMLFVTLIRFNILDQLIPTPGPGIYRARIVQVDSALESTKTGTQMIVAAIEDGPMVGSNVSIQHTLGGYNTDIIYALGNRIFISPAGQNQGLFYIRGPVRDRSLMLLFALFAFSLILIGGTQGMRALLSLAIICLLLFQVLLPSLAKGYHPFFISLAIVIIATFISLLLVSGWNGKTAAAITGTISGLITAGLLTWFFGNSSYLTGYADETAQVLHYTASFPVNFQGLLFAGIMIGALGAITDMTMSIASAVQEIKTSNPALEYDALVAQGLKVARDTIGTMTNTLVLAYVGGAFSLLLLFLSHRASLGWILNLEEVATEMVRILAGSIGLIVAVPVTTAVAAITIKVER